MVHHVLSLVLPTFLITMGLVACTKRPPAAPTVGPAPSSPVADVTASGQSPPARPAAALHSPSETGAATASAPRPSPQEFTALSAVRDIHFDFDSYEIRPDDIPILDANAEWMRSNPQYLVLIAGHCDERGTNEYNLALGERRAKAALNHLRTRGVSSGQMTTVSYGEERPRCREFGDHCWRQNRRAQFLVKPR